MSKSTDRVLITGGTGSFGKTMVRAMQELDCSEIRILSRDEEKQDNLRNELQDDRVKFYIGDVRDRDSVTRAARGATAIFHAAALKQVPSCEFFPIEAVRTNVLGSENVIQAAIGEGVSSLVCLSTDKAVFPINSMGMTKAMMEKVAQASARSLGNESPTTISCVRYGNVMYSRGSVIPLFIKQIKTGRPITVTETEMTRFLMPLRDSVALVLHAFDNARQGDLFIKKAVASTIGDLVEALKIIFQAPDHPVERIGWRHGEKLFETLASAHELARSEQTEDYVRVRMDSRDLNYRQYFQAGNTEKTKFHDLDSHTVPRLNVEQICSLLLTLPEVQDELAELGLAPNVGKNG